MKGPADLDDRLENGLDYSDPNFPGFPDHS